MDALLWEVLATGSPDDIIEVLIRFSESGQVPEGVEVIAQMGNIASCKIQRGDIEKIRADMNVASMKASKILTLDPPFEEDIFTDFIENQLEDSPCIKNRIEVPFTGKGSAIGVADWGFDFTHPNFLNSDGSTRFLTLWDQGAPYDGRNIYGYGTVYYRDEINDALNSELPFQTLNYHPGKNDIFHQGARGTHVLDIASGNGSVGMRGVASEADIIAVHLATEKFNDLMGLGDSSRVFEAIHFIDETADKQPLVINLSVGSHGDAHMGLSLIEQAIDYLVTSRNSRAVVQSCGNYYTGRTHSSGSLKEGESITLGWLISDKDRTPNEMEIWYDSQDEFAISLKSPDGTLMLSDQYEGKSRIQIADGTEIGRYYHRKNEPNSGLSQILIILNENADYGKWEILLKGMVINSGRFESWIERDIRSQYNQSRFPIIQANKNITTGSICNGQFNISVGAYNPINGKIGFFSSAGPTWDGRLMPYLTAPGVGICAAKSSSPYQDHSTGELTEEKVFLEFFDRWWSEKGMDELLDVLNENYFLDSNQKRAELDEHINRYIEEEREKLNKQFYHYSGRIALIKKIWDSLLDLPAMLEERFSLTVKGLNVYKELGARFSYTDSICEEIQSLIDRIFLLVHNKNYDTDLENVESEIVADLLIGSFEEVKTQVDKVNKIDKLAKGLAILWIFEKYDLMEEVCNIVRRYMESQSSEGDKYPSATIALLHAAAIFKGTTKDLKKALNIIRCVEEKFGENNYKVWIGLSYLYYLLWDELGDMLIFPEMVYVKTRKNTDHNDHNRKYLDAAINYSKMALDWLEKLLKETKDLNKQKHRQRAYYYALNNYIFFQTYHASIQYFLHLTPLAEKLEHISRNADVWHEDRFPDTLARYYYRSAFLSSNEKDFKFNLDEALFYNEMSLKYSKRINPIYRVLKKDLEQLKSKGFVYTRRVLKIVRQASSA